MSRNYKFRDQEKPYFISFATVYWIDVFIRPVYKDILIDSINFCIENKGLIVYGYVIMSSHVHMIIGTKAEKLENIVRDLKRHTSKSILKTIKENNQESRREWLLWMFERAGKKNSNNKNYQFWQQHNQPIELLNNEMIDQRLAYLHYNPVDARIVDKPEHYLYSSAIDYTGGKGYVKITILEQISFHIYSNSLSHKLPLRSNLRQDKSFNYGWESFIYKYFFYDQPKPR